MTHYLIVGNSAGGIGAAEAIREVDQAGEITIVSDEPYHTYSRPCISEYLAGEMEPAAMSYRPADFYTRQQINALLGRQVVKVDPARHQVELENGEQIVWDKLLLATGGQPFVPRMEGLAKRGVFTFTRLDDARQVREHAGEGKRAVVIGGGLIGVSVTEALARRGVHSTVVELKDRILNLILDETGSAMADRALRRAGVEVLTNQTVTTIVGHPARPDEVGGVVLSDGRQVSCDLVVVAIGVTPRAELARAAGLQVGRGIVVDDNMGTTHPDVYACGDAAEAYDYIYGEKRVIPIWPSAYIGGRVAGRNMAGLSTGYPGATAMSSVKYFGLSVISGGMMNAEEGNGCTVLRRLDETGDSYRKLVLQDGRLVGMIFAGEIAGAGVAHGLMRNGVNVERFKEVILGTDFGLVGLPADLRKERLQSTGKDQATRS